MTEITSSVTFGDTFSSRRRLGTFSGFPLRGSEAGNAVVNDSPVDCQSRVLTEPAGETGGYEVPG